MIHLRGGALVVFVACLMGSFLGFSASTEEREFGCQRSGSLSRESAEDERLRELGPRDFLSPFDRQFFDQPKNQGSRARKKSKHRAQRYPKSLNGRPGGKRVCRYAVTGRDESIEDTSVSSATTSPNPKGQRLILSRQISEDVFEREPFKTSNTTEWALVQGNGRSHFYYYPGLVEQTHQHNRDLLQGSIVHSNGKHDWKVFLDSSFDPENLDPSFDPEKEVITVIDDSTADAKKGKGNIPAAVFTTKADQFFLELPPLLETLKITSLDLSACHLTSDQLNPLFDSVGFLTHLDLSHNQLKGVPVSLERWLRSHRVRYLRSLVISDNPWTSQAIQIVRRSLRKTFVQTLDMKNVGFVGNWNALQGFWMDGAFPGLSLLDLRGNSVYLSPSSLLSVATTKPSFSLWLDAFTIDIRHVREKKLRQEIEERKEKLAPRIQFFVKGRGKLDTLWLPPSYTLDTAFLTKLSSFNLRHLKILSMEQDTFMKVLNLQSLETLALPAETINASVDKVGEFVALWKNHLFLSALILNQGGEDLSLGSAEALIQNFTKPKDLSKKEKHIVRRLTKEIDTFPSEGLSGRDKKNKERLETQRSKVQGQVPLTLVLPLTLIFYQDKLEAQKAPHLTLKFEED